MPDNSTYSPAQILLRGFIYLALSISTEALAILTGEPIDIRVAGLKLTIVGLLNIRAYLDKTPSQATPQEPTT